MSSTIKEIETSPEKGRSRESSLYATRLLGKELSGPVVQGLSGGILCELVQAFDRSLSHRFRWRRSLQVCRSEHAGVGQQIP